jgi:hypothetical protein
LKHGALQTQLKVAIKGGQGYFCGGETIMLRKSWRLIVVGLAVWLASGYSPFASQKVQVKGRNIRIEFN